MRLNVSTSIHSLINPSIKKTLIRASQVPQDTAVDRKWHLANIIKSPKPTQGCSEGSSKLTGPSQAAYDSHVRALCASGWPTEHAVSPVFLQVQSAELRLSSHQVFPLGSTCTLYLVTLYLPRLFFKIPTNIFSSQVLTSSVRPPSDAPMDKPGPRSPVLPRLWGEQALMLRGLREGLW